MQTQINGFKIVFECSINVGGAHWINVGMYKDFLTDSDTLPTNEEIFDALCTITTSLEKRCQEGLCVLLKDANKNTIDYIEVPTKLYSTITGMFGACTTIHAKETIRGILARLLDHK